MVALIDNMAVSHKAGDEVPKDPAKDNPNVLLRISAYSRINRKPAKGYVPRAERTKNVTCPEGDQDCVQGQKKDKDAKKDEL